MGARFADDCTCRHVILEEQLDVLIIDIELPFEGVQLGIMETLPPFSSQHRIPWLRYLPSFRFLELCRRFLVHRRSLRGGGMILGADRASGKSQSKNSRSRC